MSVLPNPLLVDLHQVEAVDEVVGGGAALDERHIGVRRVLDVEPGGTGEPPKLRGEHRSRAGAGARERSAKTVCPRFRHLDWPEK